MAYRRHNHIVASLGRFPASLKTTPTHHRGLLWQTTFQDLIPTDQGSIMLTEKFLDALHKIALKFAGVSKTFFSH